MSNTPNDRLRLYRIDELNISQKDMANALDMQQGSYSDIERGRVGVNGILTKLIKSFNINPIWLIEGFGKKKLEDIQFLYEPESFTTVKEEEEEYKIQEKVFTLLDELILCENKTDKAELISEIKTTIGNLLIDNNKKLGEISDLKDVIIDLHKKRASLKDIIKKF